MQQTNDMQSVTIAFVNALLDAISEIVLLRTGNKEAAAHATNMYGNLHPNYKERSPKKISCRGLSPFYHKTG